MGIDKITIYQNLRAEIMDLVKRQDTYLLAAFTITISVLSIAIETSKEWLAMLSLVILIPLALRIADFRYGVVFISSFMAVFLEEKSYDGWEFVREKYYEYQKEYRNNPHRNKKLFKNKSGIISFISKGTFCLLSLACISVFWMIRDFCFSSIQDIIINAILIVFQLLVLLLQIYTEIKYRDTTAMKANHINEWDEVYNSVHNDNVLKGDS